MTNIKIDDPDNYIFASSVIKYSKTGISSNRRLLVIKGGHLYYYSNIPKGFTGDPKVLEYFHQLPKSSIDIIHIKKIITSNKSSSQFQLIYNCGYMLEREEIRQTLTSQNYNITPKNTKQQGSWKFSCDNQIIKEKWINVILTMSKYYQAQQENIKKYFGNSQNGDQMNKNEVAFRASVKNPWRESTVQRKNLVDRKSINDMFLNEQKSEPQMLKKQNFNMNSQKGQKQLDFNSQPKKMKIEDAFSSVNMKKKPKLNHNFNQ